MTRRRSYPLKLGRAPSPFVLVDEQHKRDAILRLADSRVGDHAIAAACGVDVATVCRAVAERNARLRNGLALTMGDKT
jgi:hypothetical protein